MRLVFFFLLFFSCLEAKIFRTDRLEEALCCLNQTTWLLLAVDDTLIEGANQLGRTAWHVYEIEKRVSEGMSRDRAQKSFLPQWVLSQLICPIRTVESSTAAIVAKAQGMAQSVIGFASRDPSMAALTVEQLKKLHIDLSKSAFSFHEEASTVRDGVWFIAQSHSKGKRMAQVLASTSQPGPKRIVFVDSEIKSLEEMAKALEPLKIEFIGIHYTKAYERPFDSQIADLQYSWLPEILSDDEASHLLIR